MELSSLLHGKIWPDLSVRGGNLKSQGFFTISVYVQMINLTVKGKESVWEVQMI